MDIFCFQYFKLGQVIAIWGKEGSTCGKAVFLNGVHKAQERPLSAPTFPAFPFFQNSFEPFMLFFGAFRHAHKPFIFCCVMYLPPIHNNVPTAVKIRCKEGKSNHSRAVCITSAWPSNSWEHQSQEIKNKVGMYAQYSNTIHVKIRDIVWYSECSLMEHT